MTVSIKSNNVSRTQRHYRMRCNTGSNIDHTCFALGFWSAGMPLVISWKYLYEVSDPSMRTLPSFLYPVGFSLCEKAKQPAGVRTSPMLEPCVVAYCYIVRHLSTSESPTVRHRESHGLSSLRM